MNYGRAKGLAAVMAGVLLTSGAGVYAACQHLQSSCSGGGGFCTVGTKGV